jgi:hypothetical protein
MSYIVPHGWRETETRKATHQRKNIPRRSETDRTSSQETGYRHLATLPSSNPRTRGQRRCGVSIAWGKGDVTCDATVTMSDNRYRATCLPGPLLVRIILWLLVFAVFPLSVTAARLSFNLEVLRCTTYAALPPGACVHLSERVLVYLEKCERKESDPWLRDDIRIAWITVLYASRGNPQPHIDATYKVLGLHPDKVWPAICARRAALLSSASSPKKPCAGTKDERRKEAA